MSLHPLDKRLCLFAVCLALMLLVIQFWWSFTSTSVAPTADTQALYGLLILTVAFDVAAVYAGFQLWIGRFKPLFGLSVVLSGTILILFYANIYSLVEIVCPGATGGTIHNVGDALIYAFDKRDGGATASALTNYILRTEYLMFGPLFFQVLVGLAVNHIAARAPNK